MVVEIIGFAPEHNHQSLDLASTLSDRGYRVNLYQLSDVNSSTVVSDFLHIERISVRQTRVPKVNGLMLLIAFYTRAVRNDCDIIIGINLAGLSVARGVNLIKRARVLYYPLELITDSRQKMREQRLCEKDCVGIICPEENRIRMLQDRLVNDLPGFIVPNVPRSGISIPSKGRLRSYLQQKYEFHKYSGKIVLFHGSYQRYSQLEAIIESTRRWPADCVLVLMLTGSIPASLRTLTHHYQHKVWFAPAVPHAELYEWIVDADIGLLPYEDNGDDNVRFCSPQKLFDYAVCGVPFIGSRRPLIAKVVEEYGGGVLVDFLNQEELATAIEQMLDQVRIEIMGLNIRRCYEQRYNYDTAIAPVLAHLEELGKHHRECV